jgi:hypothetical protein
MCPRKPVTNLQKVSSPLNYWRCNMDAMSGNTAGNPLTKASFQYYRELQQTGLRGYKAV